MSGELKRILEALLFAAEDPLATAQLAKLAGTDDKVVVSQALEELVTEYDYLDRAFSLVEVAGGWRLRTRPEMAFWVRRLKNQQVTRLSRAALETLAIIAYKQPVLRAEVERVRGVDVGGVLRMLMEKDLVRVVGRKDLPGRPLIYGTTKRFLEVFELKDLGDLPTMEEIEALALEEATEAEDEGQTLDLFQGQSVANRESGEDTEAEPISGDDAEEGAEDVGQSTGEASPEDGPADQDQSDQDDQDLDQEGEGDEEEPWQEPAPLPAGDPLPQDDQSALEDLPDSGRADPEPDQPPENDDSPPTAA